MKKKLLILLAAVVALLVAAGVLVFFSLNSIVKKGFETAGPMLTKVETRLASARISPLSGSGELHGLFIGNPAGFKTESAITVGSIKVSVKPSSLLSDTIVIEEVSIQEPEITLEGTLAGSNLGKILANLEAVVGSSDPKAPAAAGEKRFAIRDLQIAGGKIKLSMTGLGGQAVPVPLPPIRLENLGTPEKGVTSAEFAAAIMKSLVASVTQVASEAIQGLAPSVQEAGKAVEGLKGIFKKGSK